MKTLICIDGHEHTIKAVRLGPKFACTTVVRPHSYLLEDMESTLAVTTFDGGQKRYLLTEGKNFRG
ncbi:MAG: hypothetical protein KAU38_02910 [Desulfobacterales bacterium]|nr:hypothetical protein [Desulfobacterales bacterium]